MKQALIRAGFPRVFDVVNTVFEVAAPLEWHDCADDVTKETHEFDGANFVLKQLPPPPPDQSEVDNLSKHIKAAVLAAAIMSGKTTAQAKAAFKTAFNSLP